MALQFRILEIKKSMTGVNNLLTPAWHPRWYYILRNKTTGKKYFGQTLRTDMSEYLGSGTYWKPHCFKNGGYNKNNIELVQKWWFEDQELAELFIEEFESKYENYWLKSNEQWANLIQENTKDAPNFANLSGDSRKIAIENRLATLSIADEKGITGFKKIGKKVSNSRHIIQNNGFTVGKSSAIKAAKTKANSINENGLNVHQQIGKKSKETKNIIGEDGLNTHQRVGRDLAKRKYNEIDEEGLNAHQRIGKSISQTKNSEEWKSTFGVQCKKKLNSTLSKIENNGKTVAQNRAILGAKTQTSEKWKKENYLECEHCGILCSPGNHNRWHGYNCRHRKIY